MSLSSKQPVAGAMLQGTTSMAPLASAAASSAEAVASQTAAPSFAVTTPPIESRWAKASTMSLSSKQPVAGAMLQGTTSMAPLASAAASSAEAVASQTAAPSVAVTTPPIESRWAKASTMSLSSKQPVAGAMLQGTTSMAPL